MTTYKILTGRFQLPNIQKTFVKGMVVRDMDPKYGENGKKVTKEMFAKFAPRAHVFEKGWARFNKKVLEEVERLNGSV